MTSLPSKSVKVRYPTFGYEQKLWKKGYLVIGVDEVGRGALAGAVVAGAVVFPKQFLLRETDVKIDDSKRLTPQVRQHSGEWIKKNCLACEIGVVSVAYINKEGIVKATMKALREAISKIRARSDLAGVKTYLLADAFHIKYVRGIGLKNQKAIVKGDQCSLSIAGASIVAKVYRDNLMRSFGRQRGFKKYKWAENKGYGTRRHVEALRKYGPSAYHRKTFIRRIMKTLKQQNKRTINF